MALKAFQGTDIGRVRRENQDSICSKEYADGIFALVCDGMGGMLSGSAASQNAIYTAAAYFDANYTPGMPENAVCDLLRGCAAEANDTVYRDSLERGVPGGMGTTLVGVFQRQERCCIVNVGDSRAYLLRTDGTIRQLTTDHTFVQQLYEQGVIRAEERATHPRRNELTRAVGVQNRVHVDTDCISLLPGDSMLLCSDGLYGMVAEERIAEIYRQTQPEEFPERCIAEANANGGRDNISLVLVTGD